VGEDNLQNIQIAQYLAAKFNSTFGPFFPRPRVSYSIVLDFPPLHAIERAKAEDLFLPFYLLVTEDYEFWLFWPRIALGEFAE
jgi:hypothetical protein